MAVNTSNSGFLLIAPTDDPAGTTLQCDTYTRATKFTSPAGATGITEIGWYCDNATEEVDFEVGIYSHDADNNLPLDLLASVTIAKGTGAGWIKGTLSFPISENTIYWLAVQLDNTATTTNTNYTTTTGSLTKRHSPATFLQNPWVTTTASAAVLYAIYAIYTTKSSILTTMKGVW